MDVGSYVVLSGTASKGPGSQQGRAVVNLSLWTSLNDSSVPGLTSMSIIDVQASLACLETM